MRILVFVLVIIVNFGNLSYAGRCVTTEYGKIFCSIYEGGGAALNILGFAFCGKGECKSNSIGRVYCSKVSGGGAAVNGLGQVRCTGGCEPGTKDACEIPKR